jgi:sialidase-1
MNKARYFLILIIITQMMMLSCRRDTGFPALEYATLRQQKVPVFIGRENNGLIEVHLFFSDENRIPALKSLEVVFSDNSNSTWLKTLCVHAIHQHESGQEEKVIFGETRRIRRQTKIRGSQKLEPGLNKLSLSLSANDDAPLESSAAISEIRLHFRGGRKLVLSTAGRFSYRPALVLRQGGQDGCDTYRIPGLVTTKKGTLIAVYDNRYNSSKDLQEEIDVGMSRSTDGGQTWEPMRVIINMGEWGGNPRHLNGAGDACVLYDHINHTIWVAALWMSGSSRDKMLWWDSQPGMLPTETGQFILVKSTDDGLSWSEPINITSQIKNPDWQLFFVGPGRGITMTDGSLVFPAQFKADVGTKAIDGGNFTSHATIVYSKDAGQSWHVGSGAKPNTTEAQVVELADGSLMLNMRDDHNRIEKSDFNGRAVAVSLDMGEIWQLHPTSNSALSEPNCMASLISHQIIADEEPLQILLFSNPDSRTHRTHMTIKASFDQGRSWPVTHQILLNEEEGFGYSCLTMIDDATIGIVYEGFKSLYFQKVPLSDILE